MASGGGSGKKKPHHPLMDEPEVEEEAELVVEGMVDLAKEFMAVRETATRTTTMRTPSPSSKPSKAPASASATATSGSATTSTRSSSSKGAAAAASASRRLSGSGSGSASASAASLSSSQQVLQSLLGPEYVPPQTSDDVTRTFLRKKKKRFEIPPSQVPGDAYHATIAKLQQLYKGKIRELEERYLFNRFGFEELTDQQLQAKAQVLFLGQYSTGKTTMLRYLLGQDFRGQHIGPEPTTDRYMAIVHGDTDDVIQGKVLTENPNLPFKETESFAGLAGKFQASRCPAEVLRSLTFIDTPGVLSGEKQKAREYDFRAVTKWFALRSDLVLLLFDPSKLDISDELKQVIGDLKACSSKVRIVLNKADTLDRCALTRVYGALMWAMGKILETPEVVRVFIGSFWEKPLKYQDPLFVEDEAALMAELENLPHNVPKQRINNLADRVGVLKFYLHLIVAIRSRLSILPIQMVQDAVHQSILDSLPAVVEEVLLKQRKKLAHKDVPPLEEIRAHLRSFKSFHELPKPTPADLQRVDALLEQDIPKLIAEVEDTYSALRGGGGGSSGSSSKPSVASPKGSPARAQPASSPGPAGPFSLSRLVGALAAAAGKHGAQARLLAVVLLAIVAVALLVVAILSADVAFPSLAALWPQRGAQDPYDAKWV